MKPKSFVRLFQLLLCFIGAFNTCGTTFTNDTFIGINNTNFDGLEIVVTNSTLTIDGNHTFANVRLLNGARLTHSFSANGLIENRVSVLSELHALSSTNAA